MVNIISQRDQKLAQVAYAQARLSMLGPYRVGAVLVVRGGHRNLAKGYNRARTRHNGELMSSLHAERDAIQTALRRTTGDSVRHLLRSASNGTDKNGKRKRYRVSRQRGSRRATIYVVRVGADGAPRLARPCVECLQVIRAFGVARVVYSNQEGELCCERVSDMKSARQSYRQRQVKEWLF